MTTSGKIAGHGIDAVDIVDCRRLLHLAADKHLHRYFTIAELAEVGQTLRSVEKLAGRLALKEAILKALGVGWGNGVAFTDVETTTNEKGAPEVILHRQLLALQKERCIGKWIVSTTHTSSIAFASSIAVVN